MKELSIEEKARAYDEAIKIAKEINNEHRAQPSNVMTRVFPELAKSEDDRIREALLEYFNEQCAMSDWNGIYGYQVVAWLEKQSEQKSVELSKDDEEALEMAIIALEDMYDDDTPNTTYGGHYMPFDTAANRLKSLKDRIQQQL